MAYEYLRQSIESKDYAVLYYELNEIDDDDLTVEELMEGGLTYNEAKLCRILLTEDEAIRNYITKLKIDISLLLVFENETKSMKKTVIKALSKKPDVTPGHLNRKIIYFMTNKMRKDLKTENHKLFFLIDAKKLFHLAEKARQFGCITKKDRLYLLKVVERVKKKTRFRTWTPFTEYKDKLMHIHESDIILKPCGLSEDPCNLCIEIDLTFKKIFEGEAIELET